MQVKVKYNRDKVSITMSKAEYASICVHFNVFDDAMRDFGECMDFRISDLYAMDHLRHKLSMNLGFEQVGSHPYSPYVIPEVL